MCVCVRVYLCVCVRESVSVVGRVWIKAWVYCVFLATGDISVPKKARNSVALGLHDDSPAPFLFPQRLEGGGPRLLRTEMAVC